VATDRFSFAGKARIIKIAEDQNAVVDSLTACKFPFFSATLEEYAEACAAVTGIETNAHDLLAAGERIVYAERILNAGWGFDASHDDLPARFFEEDGASAQGIQITRIDRDAFLDARARYYRVRGLDENGRPTPETAKRLGLE
jgi:aldehyde:ferredoxin oxidoreductase